MSTPLIGAHVSAAGGIQNAPQRAADIGCNVVQIFTSSPRTWQPADPDKLDTSGFVQQCHQTGIIKNVIHAIYLVNLASDKAELVNKSRQILLGDMEVAAKIKSVGVVVHLGSHQGRGYPAMRDQLIAEIKTILEQTPPESTFLIENSAGQKGKIASNLEEIRDLVETVDSPRLGWCLDTCHAFCAGYQLATSDKNIFSEIDRLRLWESLKCIHVNDSRDACGSGRDRHANLGQGLIDTQVLQEFVRQPQISALPLVLEVPGLDNKGPDKANVEVLKKLLGIY